ncbi:MAG: SulP family inorganic anion transporter [Cyclobacteriaceae bacterium]
MKENLSSYLKFAKNDLPAGLVVFLVALPLCLGIALASGAPMFAGIITGVIGGIVVGFLSGSNLSVSGPAAGLTVIVLGAISDLSSYNSFLLAVIIAGMIQLVGGFFKAGIIGLFFPSSVIKGMLAAIGLILIINQFPHWLGVDVSATSTMDFSFFDFNNLSTNIAFSISHINPGALIIGVFSLLLMIFWEGKLVKSVKALQLIPGALLAVLFGLGLNELFGLLAPNFYVGSIQRVSLPVFESTQSLVSSLTFPSFEDIANPKLYIVAFTIAIIASLETLLSTEAVDKLDPLKRRTPQNRELKAQGVGNILCGLIGGIPMTAVIVRSSANIAAGGKSKMAAVYHGVFLIAAVLFLPKIINLIPLASLAAILLMVGYKLSMPTLYKAQYKLGINQFIPFITTVVAILLTDLLIGIIVGMLVGIYHILKMNYRVPYFYHSEGVTENGEKKILLRLSEHVSFLNKGSIMLTLDHLPQNSNVTIDASHSKSIDYDVIEIFDNFKKTAASRNINLKFKGIDDLPDKNEKSVMQQNDHKQKVTLTEV